ncbi:MAG: hypothetical protein QOK44_4293 [Betaproteobacteria bacterium]|nr:hypothetical protein [Betaproteobacteria bacterium]
MPTSLGCSVESRPCFWPLAFLLMAELGVSSSLRAQDVAAPDVPPRGRVFYQDFRGSRSLHPSLKLAGPDVKAVARPEDLGLRITLPATRAVNHPVQVTTQFSLSGDFEITGTYELLAADLPKDGYGVGISLNIATDEERTKFAKVARAMRVKEGSVYVTEFWNRPSKAYKASSVPTEVKSGQLRLVRKGKLVQFLVADGPGNEFREIKQQQFGDEDVAHARFVVTDSGSPNAIDARLVDLKIRAAKLTPDPVTDPPPAPAVQEPRPGSSVWMTLSIAFGTFLLIAILVGALLVASRRRQQTAAPSSAPPSELPGIPAGASASLAFPCSGCGKTLKARADLAGKKVKCRDCGKTTQVPGERAVDSASATED